MTTPTGSLPPQPAENFEPPAPESLEEMLPQYAVSHLIAAGGMGAVYAGMQKALDRPVAIKVLPPQTARDVAAIERFRTEAKAMARLIHPNIPAVYDFDVSDGYCYLVMEYIEGWNTCQLISDQAIDPPLAVELLLQVCSALQFAHQRGITHGDIKPSNLLVTPDRIVKLADFGLAQLMDASQKEAGSHTPMGTPEYSAPELWQTGAPTDHRADLYSVGCVFYEMLTGAPPEGEFELPAASRSLDPRIDAIILKAMQADPDLRYQSAAELQQDLENLQTPLPPTPICTPLRQDPRITHRPTTPPGVRVFRSSSRSAFAGRSSPKSRRRKTQSSSQWLLGLLLIAGCIALWWAMNRKPSTATTSPDPSPPPAAPAAPTPSQNPGALPGPP